MDGHRTDAEMRAAGASAIEEVVRHLADEIGLHLTSCAWNLHQGLENTTSHRLDLFTESTAFKVYIKDADLINAGLERKNEVLVGQLRMLLVERHDEAIPIPLKDALRRETRNP
ncbi:hypothetical protein [Noviherbaspirillum galbum]|uniref:Uncharacterized protein n=1 Tax=Noviherbaspirillum galbum TaxID=2709383 RepID=A0A6B3SMM1_9BURK|nr:hypothetical protein [Noviherbaspirillum galbum]NEX62090.1 hypothetical protein [Noviherbaspirillum galbum]